MSVSLRNNIKPNVKSTMKHPDSGCIGHTRHRTKTNTYNTESKERWGSRTSPSLDALEGKAVPVSYETPALLLIMSRNVFLVYELCAVDHKCLIWFHPDFSSSALFLHIITKSEILHIFVLIGHFWICQRSMPTDTHWWCNG